MNLQTLIDSLITDTVQTSLPLFRPELMLCATIVVMLAAKVFPLLDRIPPFALALVGAIAALVVAVPPDGLTAAAFGAIEPQELFTGMLVYDSLTAFVRVFLMAFAVLFVILSRLTGIADRDDGQDYYSLVFGATIGMCLMASANHLLTMFLAVEMASVPSYVLAGIVKGRPRSSEAAIKYVVYGAGSAGVMLYGMSLLAGLLGSAHLPTMARKLIEFDVPGKLADGQLSVMVLALGGLMMGVGLSFKLSAVPFHFWCPDVFEGAPAEIGGFLSVASKTAALALLIRVGIGFGHEPAAAPSNAPTATVEAAAAEPDQLAAAGVHAATLVARAAEEPAAAESPLAPVRRFFVILVAIVAVVTCTFGNLAAYGQKNIKRLLAYSTIAHAGFMMMPIAAAIALMDHNPRAASEAISAVLLYATVYLFMNLGAFAIVAFLRNSIHSEEIKDYAGLIRQCPSAAVAMTIILFSLVGLPPLAGFWPKLRVLQSLYEAGGPLLMFVFVVAAINTAIALVYYVRVAKTICMDPEPESSQPAELSFLPSAFVWAMALPLVVFGIVPELIAPLAQQATNGLFS